MSIVLPDPSGLGRGIETAGSALAGALEKRAESRLLSQQKQEKEKQFGTLLDSMIDQGGELGTLAQSLKSTGVGYEMAAPFLQEGFKVQQKQAVRQAGVTDYLEQVMGTKNIQDKNISNASPDDGLLQATVDSDSHIDDNPLITDAISLPNGNKISDEQISQLIASPYEELRRLGEDYRKQLNTQQEREYKLNNEIRKEHRAEIRKIADPYSDFTSLKDKVARMDQVVDLIETDGASFDDNVWRNVMTALVEQREGPALAEMLKTPEQQKIYSLLRPLFATKELGGSNPSTREVMMSLAALPGFTKTKEANRYIGQLMKGSAQEILETAKAIRSLRDKNLTVSQFQQAVDERVEPFRQRNRQRLDSLNEMSYQAQKLKGTKPSPGMAFVFLPQDGKVYSLPEEEIEDAIEEGAIRFDAR